MGWTAWRKLAEGSHWYTHGLHYEGPACYELATAGPREGDLAIMYVGHTGNEKERMSSYGRDGSHLDDEIARHLKEGWSLWYRGWAFDTKEEAEEMERRRLDQDDYPWNSLLNE